MQLKFSHKTLILLSGVLWLAIGCFLLWLGLKFLMQALYYPPDSFSLIGWCSPLVHGKEQALCLLIVCALFIGILKGRTVLTKAAGKQIKRLLSLKTPTHLKYLYSPAYYILMLSMIGLGLTMRFLPISLDTRGFIDLAIGSALIQGALHYFRFKEIK